MNKKKIYRNEIDFLTLKVIVSKQIFFIRGNIQYFIACKSIKFANDGIIAKQSS